LRFTGFKVAVHYLIVVAIIILIFDFYLREEFKVQGSRFKIVVHYLIIAAIIILLFDFYLREEFKVQGSKSWFII